MNRIFQSVIPLSTRFSNDHFLTEEHDWWGLLGAQGDIYLAPGWQSIGGGSNCCHYLRQKNKSPPIQSPSLFKRPKLMYICDKTIIICSCNSAVDELRFAIQTFKLGLSGGLKLAKVKLVITLFNILFRPNSPGPRTDP